MLLAVTTESLPAGALVKTDFSVHYTVRPVLVLERAQSWQPVDRATARLMPYVAPCSSKSLEPPHQEKNAPRCLPLERCASPTRTAPVRAPQSQVAGGAAQLQAPYEARHTTWEGSHRVRERQQSNTVGPGEP